MSMQQLTLVHETLEDALREVVNALGGFKKVGPLMRPNKTAEQAANWLRDCLNESRREDLHPGDVIWLLREGRAAGVHTAMAFLAAEAGYRTPEPVEPADTRAELMREFNASVEKLQKLAAACERAGVPLRAVA